MPARYRKHLLLGPQDLPPSREQLEVIGAFNPGAADVQGQVVLLVRVAERPRERRVGFVGLPRWMPDEQLVVDWLREEEVEPIDSRVVRVKSTGLVRLTFCSHLRVVWCGAGHDIERIEPTIFAPLSDCEEYGVEDPRITPLGDRYYFTYVAVSRHGAATALASTTDFRSFERHGVIFPPENKDVVLFPEKIDNQYVALHRPNGATPFTTPEMWIARSPDLVHWGAHTPLHVGRSNWESGRVGAGTPPLRVPEGWLEIYHGNRKPEAAGEVGTYVAATVLLAANDPSQVVRYSRNPIFVPTEPFEVGGFVTNVVFPTGLVQRGELLLVYYGAADAYTALVEIPLRDLL